ncbi:hypothetical protein KBD87_00315 [Candidatus Saccharibacteria bacterium]|jgi:hypothetical protein|nr:hypothetical protein [Candidatus Saccharibacteria bacterium]
MQPTNTAPDENNPPTNDPSAKDWFNAIEPTVPIEAVMPSKKPHRKALLLTIIVVIGLLVAVTAAYVVAQPRQLACLETSDYSDLTGTTQSDPIMSTVNFYTRTVRFSENSSSQLLPSAQAETTAFIRKLATFYKQHSRASIVITLVSNYTDTQMNPIATARINTLRQDLVSAGIPNSAIVTQKPLHVQSEADSPVTDDGQVFLTVSSSQGCRVTSL